MATSEFAIIGGLRGQQFRNKRNNESSWLRRIANALLDIEQGLCEKYRDCDRFYYRMKIAGLIFSKVLEYQDTVMATSPLLQHQYEHLLRLVPLLTWNEFFDVLSHLGLGPEFSELLLQMETAVQKLITQNMAEWVRSSSESSENSAYIDICGAAWSRMTFTISIYITAKVTQPSCANVEYIFGNLKLLLSSLLEPLTVQCSPMRSKMKMNLLCQFNMLKKLWSLVNDVEKLSCKQPKFETIDALYMSNISHLLSAASIQSISGNNSANNDLLKKMENSNVKCPTFLIGDRAIFHPSDAAFDCNILARQCVEKALQKNQNDSTDLSGLESVCEKLLSLLKSTETFYRKIDCASEMHVANKGSDFAYSDMLYIMAHHLQGYTGVVEKLLLKMVEDPQRNAMWKEAFECFQKNPEYLAVRSNLFSVLDGIAKCIKDGKKEIKNTAIALSFQKLFWCGFHALELGSKIEITKMVLSNVKYYPLISEYPSKDVNFDSQRVAEFEQHQKKKMKFFFDGLISEKAADEALLERMCEICLLHPAGAIKKLVQQAISSQHHIELLMDLVLCFDCLLEIKASRSSISLFWSHFRKEMYSRWEAEDSGSIENGLISIHKILNADSHNEDRPYSHFCKEIFESVTISLNQRMMKNERSTGTADLDFLPQKLSLKILFRLIDTRVFFDVINSEQIMVLCTCLGAKIDNSRSFWNSDPNFDLETYELLLESMAYLINQTAEKLLNLKETDPDFHAGLIDWVSNAISLFAWTTQIMFLPFLKQRQTCKILVPSCLADVCGIPDIFDASKALSYGTGAGLLTWHQCFVTNPTLCPLSSLDIENLTPEGIRFFSNGWIVTLTQILPFCLFHQWHTLFEASKILMTDLKLYVPFHAKHVLMLPTVDMSECYVVLGVMQILSQAFELLLKSFTKSWTSQQMWLHFTKCSCDVINKVINDSAAFERASIDSRAFMLAQIFCSTCHIMVLISELPFEKCIDNVFILSLDVIGSVENIIGKVKAESYRLDELEDTELSGSSSSDESPHGVIGGYNDTKIVLEISDHLKGMYQAASQVSNQEHRNVWRQKLAKLIEDNKQ